MCFKQGQNASENLLKDRGDARVIENSVPQGVNIVSLQA